MGESWNSSTSRCACAVPDGCGAERCAAEGVRRTCEAGTATAWPRCTAPPWVQERRSTRHQSREALLNDLRLVADAGGSLLGPSGAGLTPAARTQDLVRRVEDYAELAARSEEEAHALESPPLPAEEARLRREALLREARQYRELLVRTVQAAVESTPAAPEMDALLFRMGVALAGLSRHDEALRAYRALVQRFPQSPYVPHTYLAFAEHFFAERVWESAAQFYERACLPAEPANRVRAYALYRLAWARLMLGAAASATALFDEAIAWAAQIPGAWDGAVEVRPIIDFGG